MADGDAHSRIRGKAIGIVILAALSAALAYVAARLATAAESDPAGWLPLAVDPIAPFLSDPFGIDLHSLSVQGPAVACAAVPWLVMLKFGASRQKLLNDATGREHGDDRLATRAEMGSSLDGRHPRNNVVYSEHAGIVLHPHDKRTRRAAEGRNLNACTFGISGLGKTFNLVKPNIMQACGDALPERPYGWRNAPSNAAAKLGLPAKARMGGNAVEGARRSASAREAIERSRKAASAITGAGFDLVNTDPKGDNVRDCGWLLLAAGFDVKVFNTIDFEEGLHYNPLAYIGTQLVDIKDREEVQVGVRASAPENGMADAARAERAIEGLDAEAHSKQVGTPGPDGWTLRAQLDLETETTTLSEVERTNLTLDQIAERMESLDPESDEYGLLARQRDMKWMEGDMGSYVIQASKGEQDETGVKYKLVPGNGCSRVACAVESMRYRRTAGTVTVEFKNNAARPLPAQVEIELDPALVVTGIPFYTAGDVAFPLDGEGEPTTSGTFTWRLPGAKARPSGTPADAHASEKIVFEVHVAPTKVADGVWLTKTVDCLCANLRGTDARSNSSEDPFWEDTKRLCFMSLIAFLFERYDERYHTLPEMMKLLDIALDSETRDPAVKSPLAVLMEMWERGVAYEDAPPAAGDGGGMVRGGRWVTADNPPHARTSSMALHCYHAFMSGAPETVQSIVISCQAALVNLLSDDVKEMLSRDELHLETLGDEGQRQALFIVTKDTDSPFDFLTALVTFQAIDIAQEKAYRRYGGKLPRHVRFELDEVANIGKIPILVRAMAVVRSRNISVAMYLQSKAQLAMVYGEKEADVVLDNCSAILFLGAQTKDTLEEMSVKAGVETVQSRMLQRSAQDASLYGSTSEQISSNERRVMSTSRLSRMTKGWMMVYLFNERAAYDHKYKTLEHPYYAYIDPGCERHGLRMAPPAFDERFDFARYRRGGYDDVLEQRIADALG